MARLSTPAALDAGRRDALLNIGFCRAVAGEIERGWRTRYNGWKLRSYHVNEHLWNNDERVFLCDRYGDERSVRRKGVSGPPT